MSEGHRRGRFIVGVGCIALSNVLWAGAVVSGALALRGNAELYGRLACISLVLNWAALGVGLILAGREGVRYLRRALARIAVHLPFKARVGMKAAQHDECHPVISREPGVIVLNENVVTPLNVSSESAPRLDPARR